MLFVSRQQPLLTQFFKSQFNFAEFGLLGNNFLFQFLFHGQALVFAVGIHVFLFLDGFLPLSLHGINFSADFLPAQL